MRSTYGAPAMPAYTHTTYNPRAYGAAGNGQHHAAAAAAPHSSAYAHPSLLHRAGGSASASTAAAASTPARPAFHVGMRIDARDAPGKWLQGSVVEIEDRGPMAHWRSSHASPAASGRSSLLPPKSLWELDQTGSWQPRGGRTLLVHFDGFSDKWDEHIHEACFVPDTSPAAIAALDEAMRPRLAPLGLLTRPSLQHQRSLSNNSARSKPRPYVIGEKVSVLVHRPTGSDESSFLSTLGLGSSAAAAAAGAPRFTASWFQAIVIDVDGDQIQIKYSPRQTNDNSFTFPVWFHVRLGEVKRFGASATEDDDAAAAASPLSPASTPLSPSAVAAANRASATGVSNGSISSISGASATPESDSLLSSFKGLFTRSPSAPHTPSSAASPAAAAAPTTPVSTAVVAPAAAPASVRATSLPSTPAAAAPTAASAAAMSPSPAAPLARANITRAAAVPPVASTPPAATRNNLAAAASAASASASASSAAASSSPAAAVAPSPSGALSLRSSESPYVALLRTSAKAPLRAPVGIINLGNSCYISAGLQCLAGLRPLIQYFIVDKSHFKVIDQRIAAARAAQRANLVASVHSSSKIVTPAALMPRFGELTKEFANIMYRLHTGAESRIYTDQLKALVQHLPNEAGARFRGTQMQDAHEFLAVLLNALHEELNLAPPKPAAPAAALKKQLGEESKSADSPPAPFDPAAAARLHWSDFESRNTDVFSHLFYGQSAQYVICSTCRTASCNHHVMGQLTLDIPHTPAPRSLTSGFHSRLAPPPSPYAPVTLSQCLSTALVADKLDDYSCASCKSKQPAITSVYFTLLPPILLVQLKRFDMAATLGGFSARSHKDDTPCVYPIELDASPLLQPHPSVLKSLRVPPYVLSPGAGGMRYRLVGVVRHHDDHYTAFSRVRDASAVGGEAWCYFNDSKTFIEAEEDVLGHEQNVYLLMYQRI